MPACSWLRETVVIKTLLLAGASVLAFSATAADAITFDYTGGLQSWTAPGNGVYAFEIAGAQGGAGLAGFSVGGLGAVIVGDVTLAAGQTVGIVAGGRGGEGSPSGSIQGVSYYGGGGGGGSYASGFTNVTYAAGANAGNGFVEITPLGTSVPEPVELGDDAERFRLPRLRAAPQDAPLGLKAERSVGATWYDPKTPLAEYEAAIEPARHPRSDYQAPTFGIEVQGSAGASEPSFCSSSMEMPSGERTKAMWPSRGGRLMVTPPSISRWQVA